MKRIYNWYARPIEQIIKHREKEKIRYELHRNEILKYQKLWNDDTSYYKRCKIYMYCAYNGIKKEIRLEINYCIKTDDEHHWRNHPAIREYYKDKLFNKLKFNYKAWQLISPCRIFPGDADIKKRFFLWMGNFHRRQDYKTNKVKYSEIAKRWAEKNPDRVKYRMKRFRNNHIEEIRLKAKARFKYNSENLTDQYIIKQITKDSDLKSSDVTKEIIDLWRGKIKLIREKNKWIQQQQTQDRK
jgi:hypothetical protein